MKENRIFIRYGLVVSGILIAYFLIVKQFNLHENPWLRLLNGVILAYGIYASIRYRKLIENDSFDYYKGFKTGLYTGFVATLSFVLFMGIYMFHIDPSFPEKVMENWIVNYNQGPGILLFVLIIEGLASSIVLTLTFMQKFKPSWNITKNISQKA